MIISLCKVLKINKLHIRRKHKLDTSYFTPYYITFHDESKNIVLEYQKSDFFCLPSLYEGYPNVVVEAMCCELPILCSNLFENPYIVKEGENGFLFDPNDASDIANCIIKMINLSKTEQKMIGYKNRMDCIARNTKKKFTDSYIKLIENE